MENIPCVSLSFNLNELCFLQSRASAHAHGHPHFLSFPHFLTRCLFANCLRGARCRLCPGDGEGSKISKVPASHVPLPARLCHQQKQTVVGACHAERAPVLQTFKTERPSEDAGSGPSLYAEPGSQRAGGHSSTGPEATRPEATVAPSAPITQRRVCVCRETTGPINPVPHKPSPTKRCERMFSVDFRLK